MYCVDMLGTLVPDAGKGSFAASIAHCARRFTDARDATVFAIRVRVDDFPSKTRQIKRIQSLWIPQTRAGIVRCAQMRNCVAP
ncbi:hypothetical protein J2S90_001738 [Arthrobacter bambusae]|uniref:Uncharacterized protein n=1 Tax=Arthrobacter bambusae TaxID=1338426 RepID=A0AAW8DE44_9MICC|nr:hypothetical protein [Arthrobacter bambusae]MDQ0129599.1 hypothetical protein [Arthrobacter bambusae]MDQ0180788.1 hypothetical protein [Arthrobacter bambusae]